MDEFGPIVPFGDTAMIERLAVLDSVQIEQIVAASQREGFRFVARLCEEWASG